MLDPLDGFHPDTFRRRRDRVLERIGASALVLPASPVRYASRDTEYPYRPDSELFWTTGVTEPDAVAVLRGHAGGGSDDPRFVLFVRPRDSRAELWAGPRLGPDRAGERYGADAAWSTDDLEEMLPDLLDGAERLYARLDAPPRVDLLLRKTMAHARARGGRKGEGPRALVDPGEALDDLRLVKDDEELARLRRAAAVTADAHLDAMAAVRPDMGEWELQAVLEATFRLRGADGPAYGTIVGSGANACVLHYVENRDRMRAGDAVLVDAGAAVGLYAGDITRTFPVSGRFDEPQRDLYLAVDAARAAAVEAVRPGATVEDVHRTAVGSLTGALVSLGVLTGDGDALMEDEAYKRFFPHQTSHWLGLDVHDPGDYARQGRSRELEPGMVLTIEPGLYFGPAALDEDAPGDASRVRADVARRYRGIGVRIEDDVVVTAEGREVLTGGVPTDLDTVERRTGSGEGR